MINKFDVSYFIKQLLANLSKSEVVDDSDTFITLGIKSMNVILALHMINEEYNSDFTINSLIKHDNVGSYIQYVFDNIDNNQRV